MNSESFQLLLSYFDGVIGPEILFSFPEDISENISTKIKSVFDLDIEDQFFELSITKENLKITNIFLEIPSQWGRGNVETAMLTLVTGIDYDSRSFQEILMNYSSKIKATQDIYKAFYEHTSTYKGDNEINTKREELQNILIDCCNNLKNRTTSGDEEGKIVQKFKKLNW
jgi:hypothetical protein